MDKIFGVIAGIGAVVVVAVVVILCFAMLLAWPLWALWNWLAPAYMTFLPDNLMQLPYWHVVGFIALIGALRAALFGARIKS